jgi:hypothetical protein
MSLPEVTLLEALSLAEPRELIGVPTGEVRPLQTETRALRDEMARLEG